MFGQAQHGDAVALDGFHRDEVLRVDATRDVEQGATVMVVLALWGEGGPGGVAEGLIQGLGIVFGGGGEGGESAFGQGGFGAGFDGGAQGRAVEGGGVGGIS